MKEQRGRTIKTSNFFDTNFVHVNNSGYYEDFNFTPLLNTDRPKGRIDYQLIFVEKGAVHIKLNDTPLKLEKNDFFIFAPNTPQHYHFVENTQYNFYWIHFSGFYIEALLEKCKIKTNVVLHGDNACAFILKDTIKQITSELQTKNSNYENISAGMLHTLLAKLPRYLKHNKTSSECIADIVEIFNRDFTSINSINTYAKKSGLSPTHFIRVFKQHTSLTPKQYILKLRMEKAKHLLSTTDMKVHEIATECGFESPLYFSRLFHKYYGVSPTQF